MKLKLLMSLTLASLAVLAQDSPAELIANYQELIAIEKVTTLKTMDTIQVEAHFEFSECANLDENELNVSTLADSKFVISVDYNVNDYRICMNPKMIKYKVVLVSIELDNLPFRSIEVNGKKYDIIN